MAHVVPASRQPEQCQAWVPSHIVCFKIVGLEILPSYSHKFCDSIAAVYHADIVLYIEMDDWLLTPHLQQNEMSLVLLIPVTLTCTR